MSARRAGGRRGKLTHVDDRGRAAMVDVTEKAATRREASAEAVVLMRAETFRLIESGAAAKGDVYAAARIAGIQAAKKTPELIPLCHPLLLGKVAVEFSGEQRSAGRAAVRITASVRSEGPTGVEMEALTAAAVAALTVYDMCKAVDRWMQIDKVRLLAKSGGASGSIRRPGLKRER